MEVLKVQADNYWRNWACESLWGDPVAFFFRSWRSRDNEII
jgi:hypothetical protein